MAKGQKRPPAKKRERDVKGRFIKQEPGQSALPGKPFGTTDERARLAGQASGAARREKGDLRRLMLTWLEGHIVQYGKKKAFVYRSQDWTRESIAIKAYPNKKWTVQA